MKRLCACGCRQEIVIKPHHKYKGIPKYINFHYLKKHPYWLGKKKPRELIEKIIQGRKGYRHSEETKRKMSLKAQGKNNAFYGKKHTKDNVEFFHKRMSGENNHFFGKKFTKEHLENMSKGLKGKTLGRPKPLVWKKLMSQKMKEHWKDPENKNMRKKIYEASGVREKSRKAMKEHWKDEKFAQKMFNKFGIKPNKKEQLLNTVLQAHFPNQWKYVGDGYTWIAGKCPDFLNCNGQKKVIELFGNYWHRNDNPQDKINHYKQYGFDCLVIWEHELENKKELLEKLNEFSKFQLSSHKL